MEHLLLQTLRSLATAQSSGANVVSGVRINFCLLGHWKWSNSLHWSSKIPTTNKRQFTFSYRATLWLSFRANYCISSFIWGLFLNSIKIWNIIKLFSAHDSKRKMSGSVWQFGAVLWYGCGDGSHNGPITRASYTRTTLTTITTDLQGLFLAFDLLECPVKIERIFRLLSKSLLQWLL